MQGTRSFFPCCLYIFAISILLSGRVTEDS